MASTAGGSWLHDPSRQPGCPKSFWACCRGWRLIAFRNLDGREQSHFRAVSQGMGTVAFGHPIFEIAVQRRNLTRHVSDLALLLHTGWPEIFCPAIIGGKLGSCAGQN